MSGQTLSPILRRWWWVGVLLVLGLLLWAFCTPALVGRIASHPRPAASYAEAVQRAEAWRAQAPAGMNPLCELQLLTHGQQTDRAIVLVHGYTNCPQQFKALGQQFYDLGYNVLIAPMPYQGLADRMSEAHAQLTAEELAAYGDEAVDIARGLGQHVTLMGISAGGAVTAWAAQYRDDLDLAVIISPAIGFKAIPTPLTAAAMNGYGLLPNSFTWWDAEKQAEGTPPYTYPRYSTRALVQTLRLGFATEADARRQRPAAHQIIVVFNANDQAVNNERTTQFIQLWQAQGAPLTTYEFPVDLQLGHDLIDPNDPSARTDVVYPRLIELVNQ